ncbi:MAG: aminoglycoside phosphotransferase family protein [Euryarchaeota archaeon]|nr:aminoglycoside phosphotransferase family protein [Euryarchaeota archaeon]
MTRPRLDRETVLTILAENDALDDPSEVTVKPLGGGVSSIVLLVESPHWRYVFKQPRERFQVTDDWQVPTERARVEHDAARFLDAHLPPYSVAPTLLYDAEREVVVFEAMPEGWVPWKERLLSGLVEPHLAHQAGRLMGRIHGLAERLGDDEMRHDDLFHAQRIDPYLRTTARRVPQAARHLDELEKGFFAHAGLVHGDLNPKNLLTEGTRLILIDHEVMTRGDPAFDLATLTNHLVLKAIHLPTHREALLDAAEEVRRGHASVHPVDPALLERADRWLGALLLARVHGKSPVEYLSPQEKTIVTRLGLRILDEGLGPGSVRRVVLEA